MGVMDYFKPKQQPVEDSDRVYDSDGSWHYKPGSEGERKALAARQARWDAAEKRDREQYKKEHDSTSVANRPQVKGKTQVQQKQLTPQQAIALARLQVKSQQLAQKNNRRALKTTPMQYQLGDSSNGFAAFNNNVAVGVFNTVNGLSNLNDRINAYNSNIASFDMSFGYDTIDVSLSNYNDRLNDLNKRLMQMLW